jgi:dTDP-4-dehydrorhamnose reductase
MRVLVTGASGYLGWSLVSTMQRHHEVTGTYGVHRAEFPGAAVRAMDLRDAARVRSVVEEVRPEVIIHTAAMTQTTDCERTPDEARATNVEGTATLLDAAGALSPLPYFLHLSTDLVFEGTKGGYDESDAPAPLMVYGRTKLDAEKAVSRYSGPMCIVRSALIYGEPQDGRSCFLDWMLAGIRENRGALFTDEYRTPVYVGDLLELIRNAVALRAEGIFHAGGPDRISRYDFGLLVAGVYGLPRQNVRPARLAEVELSAPRPADVSLDITKARATLGFAPLPCRTALERIRNNSPQP